MNIFVQLSLLKSSPTSGRGYRFLIVILFRRLQSIYSRIIPSAFGTKRIGALVGDLLGLIQPFLRALSRYSYRIYNSFYKRLQRGIYSSVLPSSKLIAQLYLEFCDSVLASSSEKISISSLYISSRSKPMEVKATITQQYTSRSQ